MIERCPDCGATVPTIFAHVAGCPQDQPIDDAHARDVCKIGQGAECCRYLTIGANGWSCEKHSEVAEVIDARVMIGDFAARGDNCEGRLSR